MPKSKTKTKIKTKKTAAKRFKITGSGKIMRRKSANNHLFFHKSASQKRRLDQDIELDKTNTKRVRRMLGLS